MSEEIEDIVEGAPEEVPQEETQEALEETQEETPQESEESGESAKEARESGKSSKFTRVINAGENKYKLPGMYRDWFLDYASYVMLDRAVPYIEDGLSRCSAVSFTH